MRYNAGTMNALNALPPLILIPLLAAAGIQQSEITGADDVAVTVWIYLSAANLHHKNHLLLIVIAETCWFFVNEHLIARLDLSHNLAYGDVKATGEFSGDHTGEPDFHNFNVWTPD